MKERYPSDPWRSAVVDNVTGACMLGAQRTADAARLLEASTPILLKKWTVNGLYGHDAVERMLVLYRITGNVAALARYRSLAGR